MSSEKSQFNKESAIHHPHKCGCPLAEILWEHEIKEDIESVLNRIADFVGYQSWQMSLNI